MALGFVLAIVTFGHLLKEPLYEFHTHVIPRLALLLFILLLPRRDDRFSIDYLLRRRLKAERNRQDARAALTSERDAAALCLSSSWEELTIVAMAIIFPSFP